MTPLRIFFVLVLAMWGVREASRAHACYTAKIPGVISRHYEWLSSGKDTGCVIEAEGVVVGPGQTL